jgi:signal transduction histidine kinase
VAGVTLLGRAIQSLRSRPYVIDTAIAVIVYAAALLVPFVRPARVDVPIAYTVALGALVCGALVFRQRAPRAVLAVCVAGFVAFLALGGDRSPLDLAPVIALFTVASRSARRTAWAAGALVAVALVSARLLSDDSWPAPDVLTQVAWIGMATAAGDAVRSRRAYVAAIEERARRAEETREEEVERRVMEERLRIARDLHDILAHHIALINVQAQVAAHVLESEPEQARQALSHVRQAGKEALSELRTTVGLLRSPGSGEELLTEPSPGLDRLPDLVASFTATGLKVDYLVEGAPTPLPAPVELAAFRIVQEALTNVSKHAPTSTATMRILHAPAGMTVEVTDDGPGGLSQGTGHGLIGMRERALSLGGMFTAGPMAGGGFRVHATVPLPEGEVS